MELQFDWQERSKLLIGDKHKTIENSNILVVGLGGVGGICAEMLCRAGIGKMTIVDGDTVHHSNLNRQIFTDTNVINKEKALVLARRLLSINPLLELSVVDHFVSEQEMIDILKAGDFDYVVDAIDTIAPKVSLIYNSIILGYKIISSMGAGGKLDPTLVKVSDISESYDCRLARIVRKRLHRLGIHKGIKVVFSPEKIKEESLKLIETQNKRSTLGTISYLPAIFGIYASWVVINDLIS